MVQCPSTAEETATTARKRSLPKSLLSLHELPFKDVRIVDKLGSFDRLEMADDNVWTLGLADGFANNNRCNIAIVFSSKCSDF